MEWDLKQLKMQDDKVETLHECATCSHKDRIYITTPNGRQFAAVWRCKVLSQKDARRGAGAAARETASSTAACQTIGKKVSWL